MRCTLLLLLFIVSTYSFGQKLPQLDKSPHDIALFKKNGDAKLKVWYGRPQKKGRQVFGNLVKYGKVWRTGANECTEIRFYTDVKINGELIKAGIYSLFTIPNEESWTIILNSETDKWGAFFYKDKYDVLRCEIPVKKTDEITEAFTIDFDKTKEGATLIMAWDNVILFLPIEIVEE